MIPAITVVIPTFNRPTLAPLAVKSVLAQSLPAAEIIVVDDGSHRDVRDVLAPFGTTVRVLRQENTGLSGARNSGIRASTTEWVAFLDDDDEYAQDRLLRAVESIRRHPNADAHLTNAAIVSDDGPTLDLFAVRGMPRHEWMEVARPLAWVLRGCFFAQSLVVRRTVVDEIGLFRQTFYEDMDLFVRLAARGPWIIDSRPSLRLIRRGNTSAMSDDWRAKPVTRYEALVRIYREALVLAGGCPEEARQVRTGLGTYLFELGSALSICGQKRAGREKLLEAACTFPALHSRLKARTAAVGGRPVINLLQTIARRHRGVVR